MIRAYRLYTGADGHSHVVPGSLNHNRDAVCTIHFEESPPYSSLDWHNAPATQYVITLSGRLEFVIHGGEKFTINPGEILVAMDTTGSGHKWRLTDDQPWKRAYVTFKEDTAVGFVADEAQ
jgi:quercetin dioxygenase-like cupin family protein